MAKLAAWEVLDSKPRILESANVDLEAKLEAWIDEDPGLVQFGLTILGRQVHIDAGVIDLLALDPQGRWCVIEIKRDLLTRDALSQVQDYAACLNELTEDQLRGILAPHLSSRNLSLDEVLRTRDALDSLEPLNRQIVMFVVGTRRSPGLERIVRFLAERYEIPLYTKLFNVFETSRGERVLVRETTDGELPQLPERPRQADSVKNIRSIAESGGLGEVFDVFHESASRNGLRARPWKRCVMYTPPTDGRRCLFTVWATPQEGGLQVYVDPKSFAEFFPVTEEQAVSTLGDIGYQVMALDSARKFASKLDELLADATI